MLLYSFSTAAKVQTASEVMRRRWKYLVEVFPKPPFGLCVTSWVWIGETQLLQQYLVLKNDSPTFRSRASPCRPHRSLWGDQIKPPREAHNRVRGEKRPSAQQNIPGCVVNFVLVPLYGRSLALVIARSRDPNCTGAHQCGVRPLLPTAVIDIFPCSLLKPAANAL